ncbi:MAG TPA: sulfite exporter TauE/SafE family protein [Patescibacteria group bacterium]|nr:sulfite exporter TauE/SafE family protein [Patescibacteria group bacterium]
MGNLWLALITGLTSGGISCFAIQGGLLTSSLTEVQNNKRSEKMKHVILFLLAKLLAYTTLGMVLGYLGSFLLLSIKLQAFIQLAAGIFILGTAGKILNLHPVFRYFSIRPPKFAFRLAKKISKDPTTVTPLTMGVLTVLMPCGVTQAMMLLAMSSGNWLLGGAIMALFVIGTSPVFFTMGAVAGELLSKKAFSYVASAFLLYFGVTAISGGLGLLGSPHTIQNYKSAISSLFKSDTVAGSNKPTSVTVTADGYQDVTINVENNGYKASTDTLKVGTPVKLKLVTKGVFSCSRAFTIPAFNISKILPEKGETIIEFTPTKTGRLAYTCSMGMYGGSFTVIN